MLSFSANGQTILGLAGLKRRYGLNKVNFRDPDIAGVDGSLLRVRHFPPRGRGTRSAASMNERESLQAEFKWTHLGPHPYTPQIESGRIRRLVTRARPIHPGSRRGPDSVLLGGAVPGPGQGGRAALSRRIDRGGDCSRSEDLTAHRQTGLTFRKGLAAARSKPYNRDTYRGSKHESGSSPANRRVISRGSRRRPRGTRGAAGAGGSRSAPRQRQPGRRAFATAKGGCLHAR